MQGQCRDIAPGVCVASKNRMKITEHRAIWEAEETAVAEYRSEMELEDFTGKKVADDAELGGN